MLRVLSPLFLRFWVRVRVRFIKYASFIYIWVIKIKHKYHVFIFFCRTTKLQLATSDSRFPNFFFRKHVQKCKKASHFVTVWTSRNSQANKRIFNANSRNAKTRCEYIQFVIFNPWKLTWNWIAFYQNSFVISPGLLYHLIRRDNGRLANEAVTSNPIVSLKQ